MAVADFEKPEYFVNRELSWLKFDDRVLSEAKDKSLPLFERLKFTSIVSSNLDEFYMVRVASLKDQVHAGYEKTACLDHEIRKVCKIAFFENFVEKYQLTECKKRHDVS